jgi:hypothetical protein
LIGEDEPVQKSPGSGMHSKSLIQLNDDAHMNPWTPEKIAALKTADQVKSLRSNAAKKGNEEIIALCDADLLRRNPPKVRQPRPDGAKESRAGQYVSEFHFVCPNELGVTRHRDGLVQSGTWVVAETQVETGLRYGSTIALHSSKAEPSYLQGVIKRWDKRQRERKYAEDQLVKTEQGIDFFFEPTGTSLPWVGDGAGEKGYAWAPIPKPSK